jgi:hypothetical protein
MGPKYLLFSPPYGKRKGKFAIVAMLRMVESPNCGSGGRVRARGRLWPRQEETELAFKSFLEDILY